MTDLIKLQNLEKILGTNFKDKSLLELAITHTSYANEQNLNLPLSKKDNERLEFLGDTILNLVISNLIFIEFPDYSEGNLTKLRSTIINETPLAQIARDLCIGDYLILGKGEEGTGGRNKNSILASSVEAIIAAIYLDSGYINAFTFIENNFTKFLTRAKELDWDTDYKSRLQEFIQSNYKDIPHYKLIDENGPDHEKLFVIQIIFNNSVLSTGYGKSKKEAEQDAAKQAFFDLIRKNKRKEDSQL